MVGEKEDEKEGIIEVVYNIVDRGVHIVSVSMYVVVLRRAISLCRSLYGITAWFGALRGGGIKSANFPFNANTSHSLSILEMYRATSVFQTELSSFLRN